MMLATLLRAFARWTEEQSLPVNDPKRVVVGTIGTDNLQRVEVLNVDVIVAITVRSIVRTARMNAADRQAADRLRRFHS